MELGFSCLQKGSREAKHTLKASPEKKNDRLVIISRGLISSELQILVSTIASLSQGERNTKRMKGKMQYLRASSICKMSVNKSNLKWSPVPLVSFFFKLKNNPVPSGFLGSDLQPIWFYSIQVNNSSL